MQIFLARESYGYLHPALCNITTSMHTNFEIVQHEMTS